MIFSETRIPGAFLIDVERLEDERGFFARTWCRREMEQRGLNPRLAQCSIAFNKRKGTVRGMHYQLPPYEEAKIVQCTSGAIHDVILDLRPGSATFMEHVAVVLTAENHTRLYVPEGVAHGYQTLADMTEVSYQMSQVYSPGHARGVRWNDPTFGIQWPLDQPILSKKDQGYPDFVPPRPRTY